MSARSSQIYDVLHMHAHIRMGVQVWPKTITLRQKRSFIYPRMKLYPVSELYDHINMSIFFYYYFHSLFSNYFEFKICALLSNFEETISRFYYEQAILNFLVGTYLRFGYLFYCIPFHDLKIKNNYI